MMLICQQAQASLSKLERVGSCSFMWRNQREITKKKILSACHSFLFLPFAASRLAELYLWLDKPLINPTPGSGNVMGNSFVFFEVSIVISLGQKG